MTQVHIQSGDHTVTVNHDGADLSYVVDAARKLWDETRVTHKPGPAYAGFQVERTRDQRGFTWNMGAGEQPAVDA